MKKILLTLLMFPLMLWGCLEDDSNTDIMRVNPIVIDMGNAGTSYSIYMFDTLKIDPLIYKIGTPDAALSYEWRLHSQNKDENYDGTVIDSTMSCRAYITAPPSAAEYYLKLTVRDRQTGIENFEMFSLTVLSPFAEGLVVADTRDGRTSDLSLIVDRCFNNRVEKKEDTKLFRNVWSDVNGAPVDGVVKGIIVAGYTSNRSLTVATDKGFLRADYYDYVLIPGECDRNLFVVAPEDYDRSEFIGFYFDNSAKQEFMNFGGKIWPHPLFGGGKQYGFYLYPGGFSDYNVTHFCYLQSQQLGYGYDERYHRLAFFAARSAFYPVDQLTGGQNAFDVNRLEDYEPLYMGQTNTSTVHLLARQKSTGKYLGLTMEALTSAAAGNSTTLGKNVFDLSSATEIANAKYFAMNIIEDAVYYATDTKVYATAIANIYSRVQWEAPAGEKITDIRVWKENGRIDYEEHDPSSTTGFQTTATTNRMMLITTYNESTGEGRIYAVPIVTLGIGGLEQNPAYHRVFDGFGRILAVCPQKS